MSTNRLTPLDASFLHIEDGSSHMHVAAALLFTDASLALYALSVLPISLSHTANQGGTALC